MLPEGIPTVTVTARYLSPHGEPLRGQVVFRAPALLTFGGADVMLAGPVTVPLDPTGQIAVVLPATDAPGMDPVGWTYTVTEQLVGVPANRAYALLLPAVHPHVDLADVAPTNPTTPNYVRGASAYEIAVSEGFVGTPAQWLASLVGPQGPAGPIASVNGQQGPAVVLGAVDVGAVPAAALGEPAGVAQLDPAGVLVPAQRPAYTAADVGAVPAAAVGAPGGVADLDPAGRLPESRFRRFEYHVRAFGAVGDGVTDDAPAFRAALDAAAAAGGGRVRVSRGTYLMASALGAWPAPVLYVRGGTDVEADGAAVIRRAPGLMARMVQNFNGTESNAGYSGHSDIRISGGTWDGGAPTVTDSGNAMAFAHAERITVENVRFLNQPNNHAIEFNAVRIGNAINCRFEGSVPKPTSPETTEAIQIDAAVDSGSLSGALPYDGTTCTDITVSRCYAGASPQCGPWGLLVGSHSNTASGAYERITVENNTIADSLVYGIRAYDWWDSIISGNVISTPSPRAGYRSGIMITAGKNKCEGVTVANNILRTAGGVGYGSIQAETLAGASLSAGLVFSVNVISQYSGDGMRIDADAPQIHQAFIRAARSGAGYGLIITNGGSHANVNLTRITGGRPVSVPAGTIVYGNDPVITP
ncbi:right-handed parallel beta-helix repeat-containing protein [Streptomyces sp. LE64]|uniref:right-handed parallel beta-helix repeat-containing protein n=1 Tax=Streptomyces sp. LE64 TaxID=3448653 RepID=UPI004042432A